MSFIPKINYCLTKVSDVYYIKPTDETDVYDATDNPTGWEDASTVLAANVTSATLEITDPSGTVTNVNVLSQIPNPVTGFINFSNINWTTDGYYKIIYTITTSSTTYTDCKEKYFYPNIKCCISKLANKVKDNPDNTDYYNRLLKAKAWEEALISAIQTIDKVSADKILNLLTKFCNSNPCDCN